MLRLKLWVVCIAGFMLHQYTTEAGSQDSQGWDDGGQDDPISEDLTRVLHTLRGPSYQTRRGRAFGSPRSRTVVQDGTSRSFVGMSWFAPVPQVPPTECAATNGALDVGTCFTESACDSSGGVASGVCPSGGVCCIFPTVCGGTVSRNRTWFVNKDFPDYTREPSTCQLTIKRADTRIKQVRLDFAVMELGDAIQGKCQRDALTVKRANGAEDLIPALCGDNTKQHVYVDFAYQDLRLTINTDTTQRRKWHILISQVMPGEEVPSGCLQFYGHRSATIKSLNYNSGSYLFKGDLDYDICFPALKESSGGQMCERRTEDIDLRQSENDVRTRRGKWRTQRRNRGRGRGRGRQGRSSRLPIVMAFNKDRKTENVRPRTLQSNLRLSPGQSFPRSTVYSVMRDPDYHTQIKKLVGQLELPPNSGLGTLLNSKSQLHGMKEQFIEKEDPSDETFYYYYYDDDTPEYQRNDLDDSVGKPATDNYAVEHAQREFVVLPDGTPVQGNYFVHNSANQGNQEHSTGYNSDKYFHTGMLENIKDITQEQEADTQYPTPTYFQRPTSAPQNLNKPDHPVASIMVFDPHPSMPAEEPVQYQDTSNDHQKTTINSDDSPAYFGLDDLTTLSTINPDAEYTLKHDGVQWLFLKNGKSTQPPKVLSSTSKVILPHEINISPGAPQTEETAAGKPHLVFKHPSGTVTEMHIGAGDGNKPNEKIVTIIETGPITQNFTKIKINDISELDRVIENIFDIVSESSENTDSQVSNLLSQAPASQTQEPTYPPTSYTNFPDSTTTDTQSPQETTYFALSNNAAGLLDEKIVVVTHGNDQGIVKDDLKLSEGYMTANDIEDQRFTTVVDTTNRFTSTPGNIRFTNTPTRIVQQITRKPEQITTNDERTRVTFSSPTNSPFVRLTKQPALNPTAGVTRFTYSSDVRRPVTPSVAIRQPGTPSGAMKQTGTLSGIIRQSETPSGVTRQTGTPTRIRVVPHGTRFSPTVQQSGNTTPLRVTTEATYTLTTNPESQPQKVVYTTRVIPQTHTPTTFTLHRTPTSEVPAVSSSPTTMQQFLVPNRQTQVFTTIRGEDTRPTHTTVEMSSVTDEAETQPQTITKISTFPTVTETETTTDPFITMLNNLGVKPATTSSPTPTTKPLFKISTTTDGVVTTKSYFTVEEALADLAKITTNVIEETTSTESTATNTSPLQLTTKPYAPSKPHQSQTVSSLQDVVNLKDLVTEGNIDELGILSNEPCENSYIKVNNVKLCEQLLRSETVRSEAERLFTDMERISIRSLGASNDPLRFSLRYETVCPANGQSTADSTSAASVRIQGVATPGGSTTRTPQVKTINLLQYLLGWYRR